ncbi:MAG: thioredoxin [Bacteroidetes bacterium]|nr:MAG: thioredoxin [Bacteroidota bacterium]
MKKTTYLTQILAVIFITMGIVMLSSCKQKEANTKTQNNSNQPFIKDLSATEFKKQISSDDAIILDVRTPEEVAQGHIEGSSNINYYDENFKEKINLINKEKAICVYCKSGGRSALAAKILAKNGFNRIYQLNGGTIAWEESNFPLTKATVTADEHIKTMTLEEFNTLLQSDKPVLVDFHTVWCAPCRKMVPIVDEIEKEYKDKAIVLRIDADKSKEIAKAYNIKGVPVFMLFKNGKQQWKHKGIIAKEELVKQIRN